MAIGPKPRVVGGGLTSIVTTVDNETVLKGYEVWWNGRLTGKCHEPCEERMLREDTIYRHLGEHPRILKSLGLQQIRPGVHSLRLEMAPLGCLRAYLLNNSDDIPSIQARLRMALDMAEGLQYMHSQGVFNLDLSTRNLFVFDGLRVKIGDLGASVFRDRDDFKVDQSYEGRYSLPLRGREYGELPIMKRELFALGCAVYEITAWQVPFSHVDSCEAEQMYDRSEFPSLDGNPARDVIWDCWYEKFAAAGEVVCQLDRLVSSSVWRAVSATGDDVLGNRLRRTVHHESREFRPNHSLPPIL
ncbi:hypothetical protein H9Q70_003880 [Fusarium xylarioides]|nr:hypothetical protein H9Q70_003880 [Fusarium xylarioides]KAG5784088.1 hypothetical protein H9Q73_002287 [Fusarium xylarioides]